MRKVKKLFIYAIAITLLFTTLTFFFDTKAMLTILLFFLMAGSYMTYREKAGREIIIAFLMALALTSYYEYIYTTPNLLIGRINLFPLIGWTFGLVLLKEIYHKIGWKKKFIKITALYIVTLFLIEYLGYYLLKIQLNSDFPSLFGLGILHASWNENILHNSRANISTTNKLSKN